MAKDQDCGTPRAAGAVAAVVAVALVGLTAQVALAMVVAGSARAARPDRNDDRNATAAAWTVERVRGFVLETHLVIDREVRKAYKSFDGRKAMGDCYGEPAKGLIKADIVLRLLEPRLEGKALQCYLASYFGCRVGDWLAVAGLALRGPSHLPTTEAPVKLVEQTADRVVADVTEVSADQVRGGVIDKSKLAPGAELDTDQVRYTFTRDARGAWRIADRRPTRGEWECRPR